jgi:glycosyltransferase involved in cell wall biosynthesis
VSPAPSVSVVVPTRNRPAALAACLEALAAQRARDFEVVVIDDGGSAPLEPVVEAVADRLPVILLRQDGMGPAGARNRGAARARGALLAFTDDDCRPDPDWLVRIRERCDEHPGAGAGGTTVNVLTGAPWSETAQLITDLGYATFNRDVDDAGFFASNNLALPAAGFRAIGGFDPSFTTAEDRDLCDRWTASGRRLLAAPGAVVRHAHGLGAREFIRVHMRYGRGAYRFHRAHARRSGQHWLGRGWVDTDYYARAVRAALRGTASASRPGLALRMSVWQAANAIGFADELRRDLTSPTRTAPSSVASTVAARRAPSRD